MTEAELCSSHSSSVCSHLGAKKAAPIRSAYFRGSLLAHPIRHDDAVASSGGDVDESDTSWHVVGSSS